MAKIRKDGSTIDLTSIKIRAEGAFREAVGRIRKDGAWVDFWPIGGAALSDYSLASSTQVSGYRINANGTTEQVTGIIGKLVYSQVETWLKRGSASQFAVRATLVSGSAPSGAPVGQWIACTASPEWRNVVLGTSITLNFEIGSIVPGGPGANVTDNASAALLDSNNNQITDASITVSALDTATVQLAHQ